MKYANFPHSNIAHYMLVGVVSFGPSNCGTKDIPGSRFLSLKLFYGH